MLIAKDIIHHDQIWLILYETPNKLLDILDAYSFVRYIYNKLESPCYFSDLNLFDNKFLS